MFATLFKTRQDMLHLVDFLVVTCFFLKRRSEAEFRLIPVSCDPDHTAQTWRRGIHGLCMTPAPDLTPGDKPIDLCLPPVSLPPAIFHLVVSCDGCWSSPHQREFLSLSLLYSSADAPCAEGHWREVWRPGSVTV